MRTTITAFLAALILPGPVSYTHLWRRRRRGIGRTEYFGVCFPACALHTARRGREPHACLSGSADFGGALQYFLRTEGILVLDAGEISHDILRCV